MLGFVVHRGADENYWFLLRVPHAPTRVEVGEGRLCRVTVQQEVGIQEHAVEMGDKKQRALSSESKLGSHPDAMSEDQNLPKPEQNEGGHGIEVVEVVVGYEVDRFLIEGEYADLVDLGKPEPPESSWC